MGKRDPRVDAYIAGRAEFARPILRHLRAVVHEGCPGVVETIKWGMPAFEYEGPLAGMAAFKAHATFGFWKGKLIVEPDGRSLESAMGQFGRLTSLDDLPARAKLVGWVRRAAALNEQGVTVKRVARAKPALRTPPALLAALRKVPRAKAAFDGFPPSAKREYVEWIVEARQDETRARRIAQAVAWMAEGKRYNWRYAATRKTAAARAKRAPGAAAKPARGKRG